MVRSPSPEHVLGRDGARQVAPHGRFQRIGELTADLREMRSPFQSTDAKGANEPLPLAWGTVDLDYPRIPEKWRWTEPTNTEFGEWLQGMKAPDYDKVIGFQFKLTELDYRRSPSGEGFHLQFRALTRESDQVTPHPPTGLQLLRIRALMGDDPKRVAADSQRARTEGLYWGGYLNSRKSRYKRDPVTHELVRKGGKYVKEPGEAGKWVTVIGA